MLWDENGMQDGSNFFRLATNRRQAGIVMEDTVNRIDAIIINEAQLILAEKRTSLAVLRTGIAVLVLPLSVMSILIATSKYYDILHVIHLIVPVAVLNTALTALGAYLIIRATLRLHRYDGMLKQIKKKYSTLAEFL
jgi:uncharacterized membrane protein YidH (DUF202 family)